MKKTFIMASLVVVAVFSAPHIAKAGGCTGSISATELKVKNATVVDFEQTGIETSAGYWSNYGVKFTADNGKAIYVNGYNRGGASTASGEYALFNDAIWPATSANQPLKVTFKNGVNQAGFYLGNGGAPTVPVNAWIKLYDKDGQEFCEVSANNIGKDVLTYVSFNTLFDVYSMSIDYGNTSLGEEIDDLMFVNSSQNVRYCRESDNGNNKYVFGKSTLYNQDGSVFLNASDSCKDGNNAFEYVCNGSSWDLKTENCGSGYSCVNGACQAGVVNPVPYCTDSDNGKISSVRGTVNLYSYYNNSYSTDICHDNNTVREYFCTNGDASQNTAAGYDSTLITCPYGCEDGACLAPPKVQATCYDTDNGLDSYTKGVTTGQKEGTRVYGSYADSCSDKVGESGAYSGKWVVEQHCSGPADNPYVHTQWNECPYGCENGVCLRSSNNVSAPTLSNFVAYDATSGQGLAENKTGYKKYDSYVKPLPVSIYNSTKAIKVSLMLNNKNSKFTYAFVWNNNPSNGIEVDFNEQTAKSVVGSANFDSSAITTLNLTDYYRGKYVMMYGMVRNNDGKSEVPNMPVEVDEIVPLYFRIEKVNTPTANSCVDSDSGYSIYKKGTLTINPANASSYVVQEYCTDVNRNNADKGDYLEELVCLNNNSSYAYEHKQVKCPYGCENGACKTQSGSSSDPTTTQCYNVSGNGFLAKAYNNPEVYYIDENIKHAFVTSKVYHSWFTDYSGVKSFPASEASYINNLIVGANVCLNTSGSVADDNTDMDTSDDEVSDCQDQTVYDGHFELCAGETLTHQISNIKLTNVRNNKNYIYFKLQNSTKSTLVVNLGKSKDIYSKDWKKRVRITYEANSGDAVGKVKIQTMTGYGSMFCGNSQYNAGNFTTCLGSTITNYPTQIKLKINDFTEDYVLLAVSGSNISSIKIKKGQNAVLKAKENTYLQVGYDGWAYGPQVNLSVKVLGMSCGNSAGNDGLYSACMSDTIYHTASGISAKVNNFTDKFVTLIFSGSSNYASDTAYRLDKGKQLIVENGSGTKLKYTYQAMTSVHGTDIKIETVQ